MSQYNYKEWKQNMKKAAKTLPKLSEVKDWPIAQGIKERNILPEVCQHYGVREGFDEETGEKKYYAFPVTRKGKLTGFILYFIQWENKNKKWFSVGDVDTSCDLTGAYDAEGRRLGSNRHRLYVAEGMFDYLSLYQTLYYLQKKKGEFKPNVVSLTLGTVNAEEQICNNHEYCLEYKQFVTCFDGDENPPASKKKTDIRGKEATQLVHDSYPERSYYIPLAKDADPNMYVKREEGLDPKDLYMLAVKPKEYRSEFMVEAKDFDLSLFDQVLDEGVSVPELPQLSRDMRGFRPHQLIALAAPPKSGKTLLAMHIHKAFLDADMKTSGAYLEGTTEEAVMRLCALDMGVDYEALVFGEVKPSEEIKKKALGKVRKARIFNISGKKITIDDALRIINKEAIAGQELFIWDHASYLIEGKAQERELISDFMMGLAAIKKKYPICIIVVCHITHDKIKENYLKKKHTSKDSKDWDKPFWYRISSQDARGGSGFAQLADCFLAVDKEYLPNENQGRTQVKIAEARLVKRKGRKDILTLDPSTGRLKVDDEEF